MGALRAEKTTEQRILEGAFTVFSRDGMSGATTREIANAAGVNEVTLFRHFESKDKLFLAVIREVVRAQEEALNTIDFDSYDLRRDLTRLADVYSRNLETHEAFIRTMLSPSQRKPELSDLATREIVEPLRAKFHRYLQEGQRRGIVRADLNLRAAGDAFNSMIFGGTLKRCLYPPEYSRQAYLDAVVDLFVTGISRAARPENTSR